MKLLASPCRFTTSPGFNGFSTIICQTPLFVYVIYVIYVIYLYIKYSKPLDMKTLSY
ncbi:MAG: hypothetical protein LBC96_04920 [Lachnospiraceae bacterium]|nr:hypothetical protein [Lachnospiraceae bacterium]